MLRYFSDEPSNAARALQAYLFLIGCATRGETITHRILADRMGYDVPAYAVGIMDDKLRPVALWCEHHELPPLTSLVEREHTELPKVPPHRSPDQQRVYAFDWLSLVPPTVEELEKPYEWMAA